MTTTSQSKLDINSTLPLAKTDIKIPQLGFGVYLSAPEVTKASCLSALKAGYRHIDTAQYYENEEQVGDAIVASGVPRSEVFVTTKILFAKGSVEESYKTCIESVNKIDKRSDGYVDLFLIHTQNFGSKARREMWGALEKLHAEGKTKAIGVSNWGIGSFEEMKDYAKVMPTVNQIELHPWHQQKDLVKYCEDHKIVVEAYCPIVRNLKAQDPVLSRIAKKHNKETAQVLVRWSLQRGWVPLPKSDTEKRIISNAMVYDFTLDNEDMEALDQLDQGPAGGVVQTVDNGSVEPSSEG